MRLFKRRSTGYCNISEPVSDLDPARISAIKAKAQLQAKTETTTTPTSAATVTSASARQGQGEKETKPSSQDDTLITETVTLETSPSAESNKSKLYQQSSASRSTSTTTDSRTMSKPLEKYLLVESPRTNHDSNVQTDTDTGLRASNSNFIIHEDDQSMQRKTSKSKLAEAKTPETFFEGKNRKRILDSAGSQAPTEHPIPSASLRAGETGNKDKEGKVSFTLADKQSSKDDSSELDKSFSPKIVSVNSDITDPSYGMSSSYKRRSQQSWGKFRNLRKCLHGSLISNQTDTKDSTTFLEMIIDAMCSSPSHEKHS